MRAGTKFGNGANTSPSPVLHIRCVILLVTLSWCFNLFH